MALPTNIERLMITALSYPNPMPPVNHKDFATQNRIVARKYRNRRIGDFLKELELTEGRGTGFPAIYRAMEENGSPKPDFQTDDATYVLVTLEIHPEFIKSDQANDQAKSLIFNTIEDVVHYIKLESDQASDQASNQVKEIIKKELNIDLKKFLDFLISWKSREQILTHLHLSNQTKNKVKYIDPVLEYGWIEVRYPDIPTHPNQGYKITETGKRLLKLIS